VAGVVLEVVVVLVLVLVADVVPVPVLVADVVPVALFRVKLGFRVVGELSATPFVAQLSR
jgi:hypothetical protein